MKIAPGSENEQNKFNERSLSNHRKTKVSMPSENKQIKKPSYTIKH